MTRSQILRLIVYIVVAGLVACALYYISGPIAVIVEMLFMVFSLLIEKIRTLILGKKNGGFDVEKLAKLEALEKHKLDERTRRREELKSKLKNHYNQLIDEVYLKWFERPSVSIELEIGTKYEVSLAKAFCGNKTIYENEEIVTIGLKEPSHQNQRIVNEAVEHLKCYSEVYFLWDKAKVEVEQNLDSIKTFWNDLLERLRTKLSVECPQLVEWHGYGSASVNYYSLRNTFAVLWVCIQDNRHLIDLRVVINGGKYAVSDYAESSDETIMKRFIGVISSLATDSTIQEKWKVISAQKSSIEANLEKLCKALADIADDVKRKDEYLKCSCSTCKDWLDELAPLGV